MGEMDIRQQGAGDVVFPSTVLRILWVSVLD